MDWAGIVPSPTQLQLLSIHIKIYQLWHQEVKKRGWDREKDSSFLFNLINICERILTCYFNITHQYFKLLWPVFFFSHPSGKIPTSDDPPIYFPYASTRTALFLFICTCKTVFLFLRKCSSICNYTFISVIKCLISFLPVHCKLQDNKDCDYFLLITILPEYGYVYNLLKEYVNILDTVIVKQRYKD